MKRLFTVTMASIFMLMLANSCSKDKSTDEPQPSATAYRLTKIAYDDGYTENYYYNELKQLRKISSSDSYAEEFFYDSNGHLTKVTHSDADYSETYHYEGDLLTYIAFASSQNMQEPDTAFFIYDNSNRISQKTESYHYDDFKYTSVTNYYYDSENRILKSTHRRDDDSFRDTIYSQWGTNGNLQKTIYNYYTWDGTGYYGHNIEESYEYDTYKNYFKTMQYPDSYLLYHHYYRDGMDERISTNHAQEVLRKENTGITVISTYNVTQELDGLPTRIEGEYNAWTLTYEKF
jgi:hypothetical protein